jgi:hypothetical protein
MKLAKADPFILIHQTMNKTCVIKYTGPSHVIIPTGQGCVYPINVRGEDLVLAPLLDECKKDDQTLPESVDKYFELYKCKMRKPGDEWDYVQVKKYLDQNHVYCYGSNITIGKNQQPCPNQTFLLPVETDFHISNNKRKYDYDAKIYTLEHFMRPDPLFTVKANWHLQPQVDMDEILGDIHKTDTDDKQILYIIIFVLVLIVILLVAVPYLFKSRIQSQFPLEMQPLNTEQQIELHTE